MSGPSRPHARNGTHRARRGSNLGGLPGPGVGALALLGTLGAGFAVARWGPRAP